MIIHTRAKLLAFVTVGMALFNAHDAAAEQSYDSISQCFWVYAPIHELAREIDFQDLLFFTQSRVGWYAGYFQANKTNPSFKQAFERDLEKRKFAGLAMKEELRRSILAKNNGAYLSIINKAVACDKTLGIKTQFIPSMANR